jgi:4-amino-4-deoxy-L-arabinose transferase-like glycosyltransferase
MQEDSPTYDEPGNIACGYSYLLTGDFRMGLAQPPLAKMLTALPLLFSRPVLNLHNSSWIWADDLALAREFLYQSGNDAESIVFWTRLPSVILCLILGFFVFKWSRELYGPRAACLSLLLYAFSPNILAHGRLATTEMAQACFSFISAFYFWKLLEAPGLRKALVSALFLGLSLSSKYSGLVFVISFLLVSLVWGLRKRHGAPRTVTAHGRTVEGVVNDAHETASAGLSDSTPGRGTRPLRLLLGYCLAVLIVGGLIAALSSGLTMKPLLDHPAIQAEIAKFGDTGLFAFENPKLDAVAGRLASSLPLPRYVVGMVLNHSYFKRGHTAYLHGQWKLGGWWYYFPTAFLLKEPLPLFLLIALAAYAGVRRRRPVFSAELILICIPVVSLLWNMAFVRLNMSFRHLLLILPFIYVLLGGVASRAIAGTSGAGASAAVPSATSRRRSSPTFLLTVFLLVWFCIESAIVSPHHLAYFNELAGGPKGGVDWLVGSNLDWGQDLMRLRDYTVRHQVKSLRLLYFGTAEPSYYGLNYVPLNLTDFQKLGDDEASQQYLGEKWAISATSYALLLRYAPWLKKIEGREDARVGFSIFVFSPEKLRPVLFPAVDLEACLVPQRP